MFGDLPTSSSMRTEPALECAALVYFALAMSERGGLVRYMAVCIASLWVMVAYVDLWSATDSVYRVLGLEANLKTATRLRTYIREYERVNVTGGPAPGTVFGLGDSVIYSAAEIEDTVRFAKEHLLREDRRVVYFTFGRAGVEAMADGHLRQSDVADLRADSNPLLRLLSAKYIFLRRSLLHVVQWYVGAFCGVLATASAPRGGYLFEPGLLLLVLLFLLEVAEKNLELMEDAKALSGYFGDWTLWATPYDRVELYRVLCVCIYAHLVFLNSTYPRTPLEEGSGSGEEWMHPKVAALDLAQRVATGYSLLLEEPHFLEDTIRPVQRRGRSKRRVEKDEHG